MEKKWRGIHYKGYTGLTVDPCKNRDIWMGARACGMLYQERIRIYVAGLGYCFQ